MKSLFLVLGQNFPARPGVLKETALIMEPYRIGSILLDVSLGLLIAGALARLVLAYIYYRRSGGSRNVTDRQRRTLRRVGMPFAILGILTGVASIIVFLI